MYVIPPKLGYTQGHTHTVVFLHGRDSGAEEFAEEVFESEVSAGLMEMLEGKRKEEGDDEDGEDGQGARGRTLPDLFPSFQWVFPSADLIPCARFGGYGCEDGDDDGDGDGESESNTLLMSQWFDMWSTENPEEKAEEQQLDGLKRSVKMVLRLLGLEYEQEKVVRAEKEDKNNGKRNAQREEERKEQRKREEQEKDLPPIFLAGISQGAAVVLAAAIVWLWTRRREGGGGDDGDDDDGSSSRCHHRPIRRLAGVISLCGWMPILGRREERACQLGWEGLARLYGCGGSGDDKEEEEKEEGGKYHDDEVPLPVLLLHNLDDEVVPVENGRVVRDVLRRMSGGLEGREPGRIKGLQMDVEWHEYEDGGHWLNEPGGMDALVAFLRRCM